MKIIGFGCVVIENAVFKDEAALHSSNLKLIVNEDEIYLYNASKILCKLPEDFKLFPVSCNSYSTCVSLWRIQFQTV